MSSRQPRSHADAVAARGWDICRECRKPYELEDLVAVVEGWSDRLSHYLCRWHHKRRREYARS